LDKLICDILTSFAGAANKASRPTIITWIFKGSKKLSIWVVANFFQGRSRRIAKNKCLLIFVFDMLFSHVFTPFGPRK